MKQLTLVECLSVRVRNAGWRRILLAPCLLLLSCLALHFGLRGPATGSAANPEIPKEKETPVTDTPWGAESDGFRSRIWSDKPRVSVHDPVNIHYEVKNVSKEDRTVMHSGFWPNHRIDVTGPGGGPATLTPGGRQVRDAFSPGGTREKNVPLVLKAGETDDSWSVMDLQGLFVMDQTGTYTVQYLYQDDPQATPVKSNLLKIEVEK